MTTLLVGFDSAWTPTNSGALVGAIRFNDGTFHSLGTPQIVDYREAEVVILKWQAERVPTATIVLLDQPTIVKNPTGQRPVENIVGSSVSLRYGGMQPTNTAREVMFGKEAPVWPGRLPKYNPRRKKTFSISDWQYVCGLASGAFRDCSLMDIVQWINHTARNPSPRKSDQDALDACVCLLVAVYLADGKDSLMVGNRHTGYIVVPYDTGLRAELDARCSQTGRVPSEWVRRFKWKPS